MPLPLLEGPSTPPPPLPPPVLPPLELNPSLPRVPLPLRPLPPVAGLRLFDCSSEAEESLCRILLLLLLLLLLMVLEMARPENAKESGCALAPLVIGVFALTVLGVARRLSVLPLLDSDWIRRRDADRAEDDCCC
jgi:hypothetical protein